MSTNKGNENHCSNCNAPLVNRYGSLCECWTAKLEDLEPNRQSVATTKLKACHENVAVGIHGKSHSPVSPEERRAQLLEAGCDEREAAMIIMRFFDRAELKEVAKNFQLSTGATDYAIRRTCAKLRRNGYVPDGLPEPHIQTLGYKKRSSRKRTHNNEDGDK